MGVEFRRRWVITREYIKAMKELWTTEESTFEGKFVKFPPVYCYPKPFQKPHPPVLIGAGGNQGGAYKPQRALKDTVAIGDGWAPIGLTPDQLAEGVAILKTLCGEAGRDFAKMDITLFSPVGLKNGRHTVEQYRDAGATRLVFFPPPLSPDKAAGGTGTVGERVHSLTSYPWLLKNRSRQSRSRMSGREFERAGCGTDYRKAENLGYGAFWIGELVVGRDPFAMASFLLSQAERIKVGISVAIVWKRQPATMINAARTLAGISTTASS